MRTASPGVDRPGRIATRNFSLVVALISDEATIQASSQERPVGSSTPS